MRIRETYNSLESMRTHMDIMAEKSYEDTRISLLMVRNEKSTQKNSYEDMRSPIFHEKVGELIWKSFMRNAPRYFH